MLTRSPTRNLSRQQFRGDDKLKKKKTPFNDEHNGALQERTSFRGKRNVLRTDSCGRWSMRVTDARLIFLLFSVFPSPSTVSCFFAATLLPEVAFARRARPGNFCLASNRGFADIGFSNVIYPSRSLAHPWSLHQAAPLVHNKGSTPRERGVDRFHWIPMATSQIASD